MTSAEARAGAMGAARAAARHAAIFRVFILLLDEQGSSPHKAQEDPEKRQAEFLKPPVSSFPCRFRLRIQEDHRYVPRATLRPDRVPHQTLRSPGGAHHLLAHRF